MWVVGDGTNTFFFFWLDMWLKGGVLRDRFRRLYDLFKTKKVKVDEMCSIG